MEERYHSYEDDIQNLLPKIIQKKFHIVNVTLIKEYFISKPTDDKVVDKINQIKQQYPKLKVYRTGFPAYMMTTEVQRMLLYRILINIYILILI